jgi:tripartite-type tricarboxylate transporter receptor subunit TctC
MKTFLAAWLVLTAAVSGLLPMTAQAQAGKPITFVVGYPPGGSTDVLARLFAEGLSTRLATPVIVVNKPGASSRIAVAEVKRAAPDGSTLLFTNASPMVIFPHIYSDLAYDPQRDFVPVAIAARTDLVLSVGPGVPESVKTLKDYVAWVRANPDQASFGSVQGTSPHFAGQLFSSVAGLNLRLIPYKGGAAAVTDLLGGHVPAVVSALGEARPFEKEGGLRMLAVMSARRSGLAPKVPSMAELGYPGVDFSGWIGLLAPANTPPAVVERLNAAFADVAKNPAAVTQMHNIGVDPDTVSTAAFKAVFEADLQNYRKAVALSGFKAND